jgi:hypothetical protein
MTVTITAPAAWVTGAAAHLNSLTLLDYELDDTDIYSVISDFLPSSIVMTDPYFRSQLTPAVVTISDNAVPETVRAGPRPHLLCAARAPPPL